MRDIADLSRHWARQSQTGKGIRLEATDVDLLNAIGVGELLLTALANHQREQSLKRSAALVSNKDSKPGPRHTPAPIRRRRLSNRKQKA